MFKLVNTVFWMGFSPLSVSITLLQVLVCNSNWRPPHLREKKIIYTLTCDPEKNI